MKRFFVSITALFSFALSACGDGIERAPIMLLGTAGEEVVVNVEIADSPEERQRGLMQRTSMPRDAGMLFVFEKPNVLYFWMQNTLIPLDVLFFDEEGFMVSMDTMEPCKVKDCPSHTSRLPAIYALEVNAGFIGRHGITEHWLLQLPQQ